MCNTHQSRRIRHFTRSTATHSTQWTSQTHNTSSLGTVARMCSFWEQIWKNCCFKVSWLVLILGNRTVEYPDTLTCVKTLPDYGLKWETMGPSVCQHHSSSVCVALNVCTVTSPFAATRSPEGDNKLLSRIISTSKTCLALTALVPLKVCANFF